ncbi:F0F1 ATP synthase subunit epsilon [Pseudomonadota bacterium]
MAIPKSSDTIDLLIVSPDEVIFEDKITRLIAPGVFQDIALLPDHTPLYAELKQGDLKITKADGGKETISIETGIVRVKSNRISVITGF